MLSVLSVFMLVPTIVDFFLESNDWPAFLASSFITLFVGAGLYLSSEEVNPNI